MVFGHLILFSLVIVKDGCAEMKMCFTNIDIRVKFRYLPASVEFLVMLQLKINFSDSFSIALYLSNQQKDIKIHLSTKFPSICTRDEKNNNIFLYRVATAENPLSKKGWQPSIQEDLELAVVAKFPLQRSFTPLIRR